LKQKTTYRDAGVDIEKAEAALNRLKEKIAETHNQHVLKGVGLFGGFFELPVGEYREPVLVSSTDGVGTKLLVAQKSGVHHTVGQDLVNHCIDDIAVCGARPLFFLDYYACGKLIPEIYEGVISGMATACQAAGVSLIGGETAEMPDMYGENEYDLCGTIVGVVEKSDIIDGRAIQPDDVLLGISANGLHTNGYSLARKVLLSRFQLTDFIPELQNTLQDELLKIHPNYFPVISWIRKRVTIKGMAHITGGGIIKNTIRILRKDLDIVVNWGKWTVPPIFDLIQKEGKVPIEDMRQTFNMGIGLVCIVSPTEAERLLDENFPFPFKLYKIGQVIEK